MMGIASKIACSANINDARCGNNNAARLDNKGYNRIEKGKTVKRWKSIKRVRAAIAQDVTSPVKFLYLAAFVSVSYAGQLPFSHGKALAKFYCLNPRPKCLAALVRG
jgi:hypothetical protein